jgi:cell division protein FtsL
VSPREAVAAETRRPRVLGALAAALPDRALRRPEDGPHLEVVEPAVRRRSGWRVGTIAGLVLFLALFAIAGAQALIVQQQRHIDELSGQITDAQARAEDLEIELAELQSPQRITSEAASHLGMVPGPTPVYLQPREGDDARAAEVPPTTVAPTTTTPPTTASSTTKGSGAKGSTTGGTSASAAPSSKSSTATGSSPSSTAATSGTGTSR